MRQSIMIFRISAPKLCFLALCIFLLYAPRAVFCASDATGGGGLVAAGVEKYRRKDYKSALDCFVRALTTDPENKTARAYIKKSSAKLYEIEKDKVQKERVVLMAEADVALKKHIAEQIRIEKEVAPAYRAAQKYYNQGRFLLAYDKLRQIILKYPFHAKPQALLADMDAGIKEMTFEGAQVRLDKVYYAKGYMAYKAQNLPEAVNEWKKTLEINPKIDELQVYIKKIRDYLADEERLTREREIEERVKGIYAAGVSDFQNKSWVSCIKKMEGVQKISREEPFPKSLEWHSKAQEYISQSIGELSRLAVKKDPAPAVEPAPKPKEVEIDVAGADKKYNEGLVSYAQGRLAEAVRTWDIALRLNPGHEKAMKAIEKTKKELELQKR